MSDTTKSDRDSENFPVLTDEQLDETLSEPTAPYDSAAVDKLLDEIARLQGDDEPTPDVYWAARHIEYVAALKVAESTDPDDAAFERDLMARLPLWHQWPLRERERAIRAGLIPDEPVDDEDEEELPERYDDLAS